MALKKPKKCGGDCSDFVCFGRAVACVANKLTAICDSRSTHSEGCEKCVGKKKLKTCLLSAEMCLRRIVPKI